MTEFLLKGNGGQKIAFNVLIDRNGTTEKHKVHLTTGRFINVNDIDVKLADNGTVKRIKIIPESILEQLRDIKKVHSDFVIFKDDFDKKNKAKDKED